VNTCRISCHATPGGAVTQRVFFCCANFGLGAWREAQIRFEKTFGDLGGTLLSLISAMATYQPPHFRLCIDGQRHDLHRTLTCSSARDAWLLRHQTRCRDRAMTAGCM
jgi:hypothetical protein